MQLDRPPHDPSVLEDFYEEAFTRLGALCERTWHDRLEVIAEGEAARLWGDAGELRETELHFLPADAAASGAAVDPAKEVFPGCPLTFRLAEAMRPSPLVLQRLALAPEGELRPPDAAVAEKLWRAQFPGTVRWRLISSFKAAWRFALTAIVRCEIQAIDQHWSVHRLVVSLPDGSPDDGLAAALWTARPDNIAQPEWPAPDPASWTAHLTAALEPMLAQELAPVRERQQRHLQRELTRIDEYFANYEAELHDRHTRSRAADATAKHEAHLDATRAERMHRRRDQTVRHEIRIVAHVDALLLLAEPAITTRAAFYADHVSHETDVLFIPRSRKWLRE